MVKNPPAMHKIGFFVIANSGLMGLVLFVVLMASYILPRDDAGLPERNAWTSWYISSRIGEV